MSVTVSSPSYNVAQEKLLVEAVQTGQAQQIEQIFKSQAPIRQAYLDYALQSAVQNRQYDLANQLVCSRGLPGDVFSGKVMRQVVHFLNETGDVRKENEAACMLASFLEASLECSGLDEDTPLIPVNKDNYRDLYLQCKKDPTLIEQLRKQGTPIADLIGIALQSTSDVKNAFLRFGLIDSSTTRDQIASLCLEHNPQLFMENLDRFQFSRNITIKILESHFDLMIENVEKFSEKTQYVIARKAARVCPDKLISILRIIPLSISQRLDIALTAETYHPGFYLAHDLPFGLPSGINSREALLQAWVFANMPKASRIVKQLMLDAPTQNGLTLLMHQLQRYKDAYSEEELRDHIKTGKLYVRCSERVQSEIQKPQSEKQKYRVHDRLPDDYSVAPVDRVFKRIKAKYPKGRDHLPLLFSQIRKDLKGGTCQGQLNAALHQIRSGNARNLSEALSMVTPEDALYQQLAHYLRITVHNKWDKKPDSLSTEERREFEQALQDDLMVSFSNSASIPAKAPAQVYKETMDRTLKELGATPDKDVIGGLALENHVLGIQYGPSGYFIYDPIMREKGLFEYPNRDAFFEELSRHAAEDARYSKSSEVHFELDIL